VDPARFRRIRVIADEDVDELGHVNNVVWLRFAVDLATAHSKALGWNAAAYRRIGCLWIVHRHEIEYRAPAFPGERVIEETWVSAMRGARCLRQTRFARETDSAPLVAATTTWVFVEAAGHRPRRIHPEVLASFPVVEAEG
jgi:acyl-CoA thioester hydrolase